MRGRGAEVVSDGRGIQVHEVSAITILLGHLRHTKSQQPPLPRGGEVLPRRSRPTSNRNGYSITRVHRGWVPPHSIPSVRGPQAEEHRGVRAASLDGKRRWNSQQAQKALHRISSIPRGIAAPQIDFPAAVLVNAKLTVGRGAPPRPRTSSLKFQIGDFDKSKTKARGASSPNTPATRAYRKDHSDSMRKNIRVIFARDNADLSRKN